MLCVGAAGLAGLHLLKGISVESSNRLGATAARDAETTLVELAAQLLWSEELTKDENGERGKPVLTEALFMVVARTLLRSHLLLGGRLSEAVENVNSSLCADNPDDMFVTAWIGVLDLTDGKLTFVNAGHNAPLLKEKHGAYRYIRDRSGLVLAGMEQSAYRQLEVRLEPGDILFLYTDGVTEAHDKQKELYGENRLMGCLSRIASAEPRELVENVWQDILAFRGEEEQFDDIMELTLCYRGGSYRERSGKPEMEHMEEYEVPTEEMKKLLMAFDELYSNICYYSNAKEAVIGAGIREGVEGTEAFLSFSDDGIPYNPLEKKPPDVSAPLEQRREGGMGIYLVVKQMKQVEYKYADGKNQLKIYVNGGKKIWQQ